MPESSSRAVSKRTAGKGQPVTPSSGKVSAAVKQNGHHSGAQPRKGSLGKAALEHSARPGGKQAGAGRLLPHRQVDRGATGGQSCSLAVRCKQVSGRACGARWPAQCVSLLLMLVSCYSVCQRV